jgi:hypothetical protein
MKMAAAEPPQSALVREVERKLERRMSALEGALSAIERGDPEQTVASGVKDAAARALEAKADLTATLPGVGEQTAAAAPPGADEGPSVEDVASRIGSVTPNGDPLDESTPDPTPVGLFKTLAPGFHDA